MEKWKAVDGVIYIRTSVDTAMEIVHRLYQKKKSVVLGTNKHCSHFQNEFPTVEVVVGKVDDFACCCSVVPPNKFVSVFCRVCYILWKDTALVGTHDAQESV